MRSIRLTQLTALALVASTGGCSFLFVRGAGQTGDPPAYYPQDCTDTMTWPVVDGVLTGLSILGAAVPQNQCSSTNFDGSCTTSSDRTAQVTSGVISAVVFAASAFYGYSKISGCRDARAKYAVAHPEAPYGPAPMPYGGGYPPPYGYPPPGYGQQPPPQPPPASYGPPPAGAEGQACIAPSNTCNAGLVCASDLCVRDPNAPAPPPAPLAPAPPAPPAPPPR